MLLSQWRTDFSKNFILKISNSNIYHNIKYIEIRQFYLLQWYIRFLWYTTLTFRSLKLVHRSFVTTQQCHNSKIVIFQEKCLKVLKCYNFLWMQRRHSCSPAASFANCVVTLHLLKVNLQTFLSIPIIQKSQILSCDTLVVNKDISHEE